MEKGGITEIDSDAAPLSEPNRSVKGSIIQIKERRIYD
jgi:hypothetical protein